MLLGRIAPLEGIGPDQLTIDALVDRVRQGDFSEVIMATNPTVEGDGTVLYISNQLADLPVELTRLARGITSGSVLEFTNKEILGLVRFRLKNLIRRQVHRGARFAFFN